MEKTDASKALDISNELSVRDVRDALRIKHNQTFVLMDEAGEISRQKRGYGVYFRDTCYLDTWELRIHGDALIPLAATQLHGSESRMELTNPPLQINGGSVPQGQISIQRRQVVGDALVDELALHNLSPRALDFDLTITMASQFVDLFAIRGARQDRAGRVQPPSYESGQLVLSARGADGHQRRTIIHFDAEPECVEGGTARYHVQIGSRERWRLRTSIKLEDRAPSGDGAARTAGSESAKEQHQRFGRVLSEMTVVHTNNSLFDRALERALGDVRMLATANEADTYLAAGIPWYVALFGRDSCIAAMQLLAFQPKLARSTLEVLARYQGKVHDDFRDEEPGKILHELRVGEMANMGEIPMTPYYGTVDATPWFLILLDAYVQWTGELEFFRSLAGNVERALGWIDASIEGHPDMFLSYGSRSMRGLQNHGWKDSGNSIVDHDGRLARPPIALVEVQGYVYAAWCGVARLFRLVGSEERAGELETKAAALKKRFEAGFFLEKAGYYALAIGSSGSVADAVASNPGHLLFTGIIDDSVRRQAVADRLLGEDMFTGWGIRTLAQSEKAYNPLDYQVGAVWPHDNSIIAFGFHRAGLGDHLERLFSSMFEAASLFPEYRLPEVFDGFARREYPRPVPYPVACSPQAWAAGTLPFLLQASLGLEPAAPEHRLYVTCPHLPKWLSRVELRGLRVGEAKVDLHYEWCEGRTLVGVVDREGRVEVVIRY